MKTSYTLYAVTAFLMMLFFPTIVFPSEKGNNNNAQFTGQMILYDQLIMPSSGYLSDNGLNPSDSTARKPSHEPANKAYCTYTVELWDDGGNGWNGGFLDVFVDGVLVLPQITLLGGYGPDAYAFDVSTGSIIEFLYSPGAFPQENYYYVYDNSGNVVFEDGVGEVPPDGGTITGNCGPHGPVDLFLLIGDWVTAEPWHDFIGDKNAISRVQLFAHDPQHTIIHVVFLFSIDNGATWTQFFDDDDGTQADISTYECATNDGDGWSGYFPHDLLPQIGDVMVLFKAEVVLDDGSTTEVTASKLYDPTAPSLVQTNLYDWMETEENQIIIDIDPAGCYDLDYVWIEIVPKLDSFQKGIPPISQQPHSSSHCSPTAAAACLKYFESQGDTTVTGGLSDHDLVDTLAGRMHTNDGHWGTYLTDIANGLRTWIGDNGGGYTVRGPMNYNWNTMRNELERCQDVISSIFWDGGCGHSMTFNSVVNTPNADGTITVDWMDPWTGKIEWGNMNPLSGHVTGFTGAGASGTMGDMIIVCPEEGSVTPPGGTIFPGPFPGSITLPIPGDGLFFIRMIYVDQSIHAHRVDFVLKKTNLDWGDAPDDIVLPGYPTLAANGGANHIIVPGIFLGASIDAEPDGQPSFASVGDDNNPAPSDEDGVLFLSSLIPGKTATISVTASVDGFLNAWVDFNMDQDWAGEQIFADKPITSGLNILTFNVPSSALTGITFVRFRFTSYDPAGLLSYKEKADDGEVEDYMIEIVGEEDECKMHNPQWPDMTTNGVDVYAMGNPNMNIVVADDFMCTETGLITDIHIWGSWLNDVLPGDNLPTFHLSIWTDNPDGPYGYSQPDELLCDYYFTNEKYTMEPYAELQDGEWFYWPQDDTAIFPGDFSVWKFNFYIPEEEACVQDSGNIYWLSVNIVSEGITNYHFGWKCSDDHFNDNAVFTIDPPVWNLLCYPAGHPLKDVCMDMAFYISGHPQSTEEFDWGDAPDGAAAPLYPTLLANNGAYHLLDGYTFMGWQIDAEANGIPDAMALGDDLNNLDDEDGVTLLNSLLPGSTANVQVFANGNCLLNAWFDWNNDGNWSGATEHVFTDIPLNPGANFLTLTVPNTTTPGDLFARFRVNQNGGIPYYGYGYEGEVEDYKFYINDTIPNIKMGNEQYPDPSGWDVNFTFPAVVGDDWICNETGPVTDFHFWVSWLNDMSPEEFDTVFQKFDVSIYSDIPDSLNPAGFSMPGELLWNREFFTGEFSCEPVFDQLQGWFDPINGNVDPKNHLGCYRIDITGFDDPFIQEEGNVYWLVITDHIQSTGGSSTQDVLVTLDGIDPNIQPYETWTESDVVLSIQDFSGPPSYQIDPDGIMMFPALLNCDLTGLPGKVISAEVDIIPWCTPPPCGGEVILYEGSTVIDQNTHTGSGGMETIVVSNTGGATPDRLTVSSYEGKVLEIRFVIEINDNYQIGWKTSLDHWNDNAVYKHADVMNWNELWDPATQQALDMAFVITGPPPLQQRDWGDAPDGAGIAGYPTLASNSGAYHNIVSGIYLGTTVDAESNGQPSPSAVGDDNNPFPTDEDGIRFLSSLVPGKTATISVTASVNGFLNAWIDFNGDKDWSGEQIFTDKSIVAGLNVLTFNLPSSAITGTTFARFRFTSYNTGGALTFKNGAYDGEVEDYLTEIVTDDDKSKMHNPQWPDLTTNGLDVYCMSGGNGINLLADDFLCTETGLITDIHIWGSWLNDEIPFDFMPGFHLAIWSDNPNGNSGFSQPDEPLCDYFFLRGQYTMDEYAEVPDGEGFYWPQDNTAIFPADFSVWKFNFYIPEEEACVQDSGSIYWLSVEIISDTTVPYQFGWKSSRYHFNDYAVWSNDPPGWYMLCYPSGHPLQDDCMDLAFYISGHPETTTADIWIKDCNADNGMVPSNAICGGYVCAGPDIWIDNNSDGIMDAPVVGAVNRLYIRGRNLGPATANNVTASLYYRDCSTGLNFPTGAFSIGSIPLPAIPAGGALFNWVPWTVPSPPAGSSGHWCIGGIVTAPYDPQTNEWSPLDNNVCFVNIWALYGRAGSPIPPKGIQPIEAEFLLRNPFDDPGAFVFDADIDLPADWIVEFFREGIQIDLPYTIDLGPFEEVIVNMMVTPPEDAEQGDGGTIIAKQYFMDGYPDPEAIVGDITFPVTVDLYAPEAITDLSVTSDEGVVLLSWTPVENDVTGNPDKIACYNVYKGDSLNFEPSPDNRAGRVAFDQDETKPGFQWYDLAPGKADHYYIVRVEDEAGYESENSNVGYLPEEQYYVFFGNWRGLSSYLNPVNPDIQTMFADLINDDLLTILYNPDLGIFWPEGNVYTLTTWDSQYGYIFKTSGYSEFTILGDEVTDKTVDIAAHHWTVIPVLGKSPESVAVLFSLFGDQCVVKSIGDCGVYWPYFNINTIGNLIPGYGYIAYATVDGSITFATKGGETSLIKPFEPTNATPWNDVHHSPVTHVIAFPENVVSELEPGDVIGAFNSTGICTGMVEYREGPTALSVSGEDISTPSADGMAENEPLTFRLYRPSVDKVFDLEVVYDPTLDHSGMFHANGLSAVADLKLSAAGMDENTTSDIFIYPNPTTGTFTIKGLASKAELVIYTPYGKQLLTKEIDGNAPIDMSMLPKGIYLIKITDINGPHFEKLILK